MRLSEWRAKAPFKNSVRPRSSRSSSRRSPRSAASATRNAGSSWGDDPTVRYLLLVPTPERTRPAARPGLRSRRGSAGQRQGRALEPGPAQVSSRSRSRLAIGWSRSRSRRRCSPAPTTPPIGSRISPRRCSRRSMVAPCGPPASQGRHLGADGEGAERALASRAQRRRAPPRAPRRRAGRRRPATAQASSTAGRSEGSAVRAARDLEGIRGPDRGPRTGAHRRRESAAAVRGSSPRPTDRPLARPARTSLPGPAIQPDPADDPLLGLARRRGRARARLPASQARGRDRLPSGPAIYCFNHLSWADPFVLMAVLPFRPRLWFFGPKEEDMRVGGRNRVMHWTGTAIPYKPGKNDLLEATRRVAAVIDTGVRRRHRRRGTDPRPRIGDAPVERRRGVFRPAVPGAARARGDQRHEPAEVRRPGPDQGGGAHRSRRPTDARGGVGHDRHGLVGAPRARRRRARHPGAGSGRALAERAVQ